LTETVGELAREGKMKAYCIGGEEDYWIDVDTFRSLKAAEKMISMHSQTWTNPEKIRSG